LLAIGDERLTICCELLSGCLQLLALGVVGSVALTQFLPKG